MSTPQDVDGLLARLAAGEIPDNVRLAAARGALPLPVQDLLRVQVFLASADNSEQVRSTASDALMARDAADIAAVMAAADVAADVADYFAAHAGSPAVVMEALAQNSACPESALNHLASRSQAGVLDRLLRNEVLLIRYPDSLAVLEANEALTAGQRGRLAEIRVHFVERPLPQAEPEVAPVDPDLAQEIAQAMVAAEEYERDAGRAPAAAGASDPVEEHEDQDIGKHAMFRIMDMTTAEKVKLAFLGNPEERAILIRDANRVVATSVLRSPRVSDKDVENYANMRSLSEELIVMIANKRDWIRNYQVMLGVVKHPKSPPRVIMNLLPRVQDRDLKLLSKDRNLPEMTRQQVRRAFLARSQRKSSRH